MKVRTGSNPVPPHRRRDWRLRKSRACRCAAICALLAAAGGAAAVSVRAWQSDRGDGSFANPPLSADYPDPDVIRVGDDFYWIATTFVNTPGLTVLHSRDLVNWEIVSHVIVRLDGRKEYDLTGGTAYRSGNFAASLRYRHGTFYVAVTPVGQHTRIYSATDIRGPWECRELDRSAFDPGLFLAADGTAYVATAGGWDGTITLLQLDPGMTKVVAERKIHYVAGAEGSKLVQRGDWYYLFNSIPAKLALTVSRARSLFGPWETRPQIDDRTGGHQGAVVELADGAWYGFVMCDRGPIGRVTQFSPVFWRDDWPVWGRPDRPGLVPAVARKPIQGQAVRQPATSDEFDSPTLGGQWQWNHNPDDRRWSLGERAGFLRLHPAPAAEFWDARNTLTQKGQGPWSRGVVKLDLRHLAAGTTCGFGTLGKISAHLAVVCAGDGRRYLTMKVRNDGVGTDVRVRAQPIAAQDLWLQTAMDFDRRTGRCAYSTDGVNWTGLGGDFPLAYDWRTGTFQGEQYAIFCYSEREVGGWVDVDWFHFSDRPDGPAAPAGLPARQGAVAGDLSDARFTPRPSR